MPPAPLTLLEAVPDAVEELEVAVEPFFDEESDAAPDEADPVGLAVFPVTAPPAVMVTGIAVNIVPSSAPLENDIVVAIEKVVEAAAPLSVSEQTPIVELESTHPTSIVSASGKATPLEV